MGALNYFADTIFLVAKQKSYNFIGWDTASKKIEAWGGICSVFQGDAMVHHGKYETIGLIEETKGFGA